MSFIFKIAVWILVGFHVIKPFVHADLAMAIGVCAAVILLSGLTLMGDSYKKATLVFWLGGSGMLIYFHESLSVWITAVGALTNVISILVMMQLFSIPIKAGEYDSAIRYWLNRSFKGIGGLFLFTTAATHVFTSFLMFGAIPVMVSLMEDTLKSRVSNSKRFMATAISRGYALASLWAPGAINLFLVMQATGVSWSAVFIPGVVLSFIGIGISYFLEDKFYLSFNQDKTISSSAYMASGQKQNYSRAVHIIWVVISLVFFTFLFDKLHIGNSSNRIILAGFIVVFSWIILLIKQPALKTTISDYWQNGVLKASDLAPFFVAMGIFSTAIEQSGFLGIIQIQLQGLTNFLGLGSIIIIPLLVICAAIIGIHPFITIVMFGKILSLLHLPVSSTTVALCLALGGSISYMVSPFAGVIMTIAKFLDAKASDVAIIWNWVYSIVYFSVGIIFAYLWGLVL